MVRSLFRFILSIYVFLYRRTGGKVRGLPVLLLTTIGRKTGKQRITPLGYFEDNSGYVITGSNAGFNTNPGWFHNLKNNPRAIIQVNDRQFTVSAEIAGSEKRRQLWARLMEFAPSYGDYAKRTSREIPLVILRPVKT